jgi:hypothetical protein
MNIMWIGPPQPEKSVSILPESPPPPVSLTTDTIWRYIHEVSLT